MSFNHILLPAIADGEDKTSALKNRIRKNYRHMRKWAKRTGTNAFRIYNRDIKEYPLAIDFYGGNFCIHFFSYDRENDEPHPEIKQEVNEALVSIFNTCEDNLYWRTRKRRLKIEQYEKVSDSEQFSIVHEFGVKFKVNFHDYLDTGLFLDHRETRQLIAAQAKGKRVLNLFAYTCSFSVHAALMGASFTKSVDLSNTYTAWGKDNFLLNSIPLSKNEIIRADCFPFLDKEILSGLKYDLIIIDPPTISRSKKMEEMFDIQQDYIPLISKSLKLLSPEGILYFSTNSKKFQFDLAEFENCEIRDITHKTIPLDFQNKKIHFCWEIRKKAT